MKSVTIEKRLSTVEEELEKIKCCLERLMGSKRKPIQQIVGIAENNPAFSKAMKLAAELRRADRSLLEM